MFEAEACQKKLPKWVDLKRSFHEEVLKPKPRIGGALLEKVFNLFKNNRNCADDSVVAEMLSVLDEDVMDTLAEVFVARILSRENRSETIWKEPMGLTLRGVLR
jgi:hypothetical protein